MAVETEAKIQVADHEALREQLVQLGARREGERLEVNIYFDTAQGELFRSDRALRLRSTGEENVLAYKGPAGKSRYKQRLEIQTAIEDGVALRSLLVELGFAKSLLFEKRRESWLLDKCQVELDSLPLLGLFVEVEGPCEAAIEPVLCKLGFDKAELIGTAYPILLQDYLERTNNGSREIRFGKP